jgi:hypothetical protein
VVALELLVVVEKECERVVDRYRREMVRLRQGAQAARASAFSRAFFSALVHHSSWCSMSLAL